MARKVVIPAYDPSEEGIEPIEIEFRGRSMMSIDVIPASAMLKLGRIFANTNDLSDQDGDRIFEMIQGQYEMVLSLIEPADRHIFEEIVEEAIPPVSIQEFASAITLIVGELMGNPSEPSLDSVPTTSKMQEGSTAPSSPQGTPGVLLTSQQLLS